jgi:hypothetical protein
VLLASHNAARQDRGLACKEEEKRLVQADTHATRWLHRGDAREGTVNAAKMVLYGTEPRLCLWTDAGVSEWACVSALPGAGNSLLADFAGLHQGGALSIRLRRRGILAMWAQTVLTVRPP